MAGFTDKRNGPLSSNSRPFSLSNALKTLSSFGMRYDDMVLRQSQAIGPMEDQFGYKEMNPFGLANCRYLRCICCTIHGRYKHEEERTVL